MQKRYLYLVVVFVAISILLSIPGLAGAAQLAFWDFENATSTGSISTAQATSSIPYLSAVITQDGGGPAEVFQSPFYTVFLTRFFGLYHPWAELTVTGNSIFLNQVTFQHIHNNNNGYPTYPDYYVQLQIDTGSGYVDIGDPVLLDQSTSGTTATVDVGNIVLSPGTYRLRWDPRGLHGGTNTNTEFFALNDVALEGGIVPTDVPAIDARGAAALTFLLGAASIIILLLRRRA